MIYTVIPIAAVTAVIDHFFLGRVIKRSLPHSPEDLLLFSIFFVLPHIFASALMFADSEYLSTYRNRLIPGIIGVAMIMLMGPKVLGEYGFQLAFVIITVIHFSTQQLSLAKRGLRDPGFLYEAWRLLGIVSSVTMHFAIYRTHFSRTTMILISACLMALQIVITPLVSSQARSRDAALEFWILPVGGVLSLIGMKLGYFFFIILAGRLIHDLTAFAVYVVHDHNRNQVKRRNWIHRLFPRAIPSWFICPAAAVLVSLPLTLYQFKVSWGWNTVIAISLFHYFTESWAWRGGSAHRKFVAFGPAKKAKAALARAA